MGERASTSIFDLLYNICRHICSSAFSLCKEERQPTRLKSRKLSRRPFERWWQTRSRTVTRTQEKHSDLPNCARTVRTIERHTEPSSSRSGTNNNTLREYNPNGYDERRETRLTSASTTAVLGLSPSPVAPAVNTLFSDIRYS